MVLFKEILALKCMKKNRIIELIWKGLSPSKNKKKIKKWNLENLERILLVFNFSKYISILEASKNNLVLWITAPKEFTLTNDILQVIRRRQHGLILGLVLPYLKTDDRISIIREYRWRVRSHTLVEDSVNNLESN